MRSLYRAVSILCVVGSTHLPCGADDSFAIHKWGTMNLRPQEMQEHPGQENWIGGLSLIASENTWPLLFMMPFLDASPFATGTGLQPRCHWWDVQWGYVSPLPLKLQRLNPIDRGDMRLIVLRHALSQESRGTVLDRRIVDKDWVHVRYRYQYEAGQIFEAVYSRLAPGFMFSTTGDTLRLFADNWVNFQVAGRPDKEVGLSNWPRLTRKLLAHMEKRTGEYQRHEMAKNIMPWLAYGGSTIDYVSLCLRPTALAYMGKGKVEVRGGNVELSGSAMKEPWLLTWFGEGSPLYTHTLPGFQRGVGSYGLHQMDCPFLLILEKRPETVLLERDGLTLEYAGQAGRVILMPARGVNFFEPEETEAWRNTGKIPETVVEQCRFWTTRLMDFPLTITEDLRVSKDRVWIESKVSYERLEDNWAMPRKRIAPISPMLACAHTHGFPVKLSAEPLNCHYFTKYGNYMVVDGADSYSAELGAISKYVWERREVPELRTPEEKTLAAKLDTEVRRMIRAGHLAPFVSFTFPYLLRTWHWQSSSELIYSCAAVADYLSPGTKKRLKVYLKNELESYPPGTFVAQGAPRALGYLSQADYERVTKGAIPHLPELFRKRPEVLYHLWCYADKLDCWEYIDKNWSLIDTIFRYHFHHMDWPTSFFAMFRCRSPHMSYRRGIHDVNAFIAGAIAYARMAQQLGRDAESSLGYGLASKWLMMRFACAKFDEHMHEEGLIRPIPGSARMTEDWWEQNVTKTIGLRQVFAVDQFGVMLDRTTPVVTSRFYGGPSCRYRHVFPEIGRFLLDFNKELEQRPFGRVIETDPVWHFSGGMFAPDAGNCCDNFLAAANIMQLPPEQLIGYLVEPDCVGDLYFFQKAAAAINRTPQALWRRVVRDTR